MTSATDGSSEAPDAARVEEEDVARMRRDVLRFLRVRERTRREVANYLSRRGHAPALAAQVLEELCERGFVDDRRFAGLFLRDRQRLRPMGRAAVLQQLAARGVSAQLAMEALEAADPPWDDRGLAEQLLARRWERWPAEERARRATALLRRRGFASDAIRGAISAQARRSDDTA